MLGWWVYGPLLNLLLANLFVLVIQALDFDLGLPNNWINNPLYQYMQYECHHNITLFNFQRRILGFTSNCHFLAKCDVFACC